MISIYPPHITRDSDMWWVLLWIMPGMIWQSIGHKLGLYKAKEVYDGKHWMCDRVSGEIVYYIKDKHMFGGQ